MIVIIAQTQTNPSADHLYCKRYTRWIKGLGTRLHHYMHFYSSIYVSARLQAVLRFSIAWHAKLPINLSTSNMRLPITN